MTFICFNCARGKDAAMLACPSCGARPSTQNDMAVSLMLTPELMTPKDLACAELVIRGGQRITLDAGTQKAIMDEFRQSVAQIQADLQRPPAASYMSGLRGWAIFFAAVALLMAFITPWPHFRLARLLDTVSGYQSFAGRFPHSQYTPIAQDRMRVLRDDEVWAQASASDDIRELRNYRNAYPDGKHLAEARAKIEEIADLPWASLVGSRSDTAIKKFLKDFPETSWRPEAEARIESLYNDFAWVREQDSLEHYRRFLERFPAHEQRSMIEKRIIDLEVKAIAAGDYGQLPPAQALGLGGSTAEVEIGNDTGYELTVRYSGPDSQKVVIPKGEKKAVSLAPGSYQVAASVNASHVRNYYGTDIMRGGTYSSSFYIKSGPEFGSPSIPDLRSLFPPKR